jgi:hypothetical protein
MRAAVLIVGAALSGCSLSPETRIEEVAFQTIHLVDTAQTLDLRRCHYQDRVFRENDELFNSGWIIGHHPSDAAVYQYMAAEAAAHAVVTWALSRYAPPWGARGWEFVTIGVDGYTVEHNFSIGLRTHL